ncbi:MAG TPA: hypothetical protein VN828_25410 [Acidobacteriaceae bacterium]|nr:hypothetical protein [Acidobacteriaceae bacterium]
MGPWTARIVGLAFLVVCLPCHSQLGEIDTTKLPQSPAVQAAYRSAHDLEPYARTWSPKWNYDIPQSQVQDKLADDLGILAKALQADPSNHELQLLTGLVAHFAYNVNDEAAFQIAKDNLTKAASADPSDIRGEWFLGIHQCQSLQVVDGMNRLLTLEDKVHKLPADFWDDYITCASVSILPAHTLRAIDRAVAVGQPPEKFKTLSGIASSRYKTADLSKTITAHDVWTAEKLPNDGMSFISRLCGVSFSVNGNWELQINDVTNGICSATSSPPAKKGQSVPTFLLMVKAPTDGQTLEDFAKSFLRGRNAQVSTAADLPCPVEHCLSLDVLLPDMYPKQGGGHIVQVAFERDQPPYDGLVFEKPMGPPMQKGQAGPVAFHADPNFRRIPGKLYYLLVLDSNQQIFANSKPEFDQFLKSLVVE